ncbi:hypothetical protein F5148DRAFT_327280 [Russula earlei]|uniref:Uncharacterized protein n=1 Tax=Russula earlei TaxID=71964 RepID=A0ACC0UL14_9AGAM|nr:hypothetical protein F5148DRAFT_327280 [Russula earlei]
MSPSCDYDNFRSPFDDPDADLILRSRPVPVTASEVAGESNAIATQFRVHKLFLIKASPVFKRLLSETSSRHSNPDNQLGITRDNYDGLPVLCLSEDRDTLHSLLTAIYPINISHPLTIEAMLKTCAASRKYKMTSTLARFQADYTRVASVTASKTALRTYMVAFNDGRKEEALEAALWALPLPQTIETYGEDLCLASGAALYALWRYRQKALETIEVKFQDCVQKLGDFRGWINHSHSSCSEMGPGPRDQLLRFTRKLITDFSPMSSYTFFEFMKSQGEPICKSCKTYLQLDLLRLFEVLEECVNDHIEEVHRDLMPLFDGSEEPADPPPSGEQPRKFGTPFDRGDADLVIRTSDQTDFHVHKAVLRTASAVFGDMFTAPGPSPSEQGQNIPIISLTEDSKTLHRLLTMIYPIDRSIPETLEDTLSLLATCNKYQMDSTASRIRHLLKKHTAPLLTTPNALRAYGFASRYHFKEEVLLSARLTLERALGINECGEDLRFMSGADLFRLWRYRTECTKIVRDCISGLKSNEKNDRSRSGRNDSRQYVTEWCYDYFHGRVADKPSPKLVTDQQAFETALTTYRNSYPGSRYPVHSQADETRLLGTLRADVETKLTAAINEVDVEILSMPG